MTLCDVTRCVAGGGATPVLVSHQHAEHGVPATGRRRALAARARPRAAEAARPVRDQQAHGAPALAHQQDAHTGKHQRRISSARTLSLLLCFRYFVLLRTLVSTDHNDIYSLNLR